MHIFSHVTIFCCLRVSLSEVAITVQVCGTNMLGSYGDLGVCGKISASTVFDPIIDIMVLKYLKSLVIRSLNKRPRRKIQVVVLQAATR